MKPATLKVRAVAGRLVPVARQRGALARYEGRSINHAAIDACADVDACYPIVDSVVALADGADRYNEVARAVRGGDLLAVDSVTASFCGVKLAAQPRK